MDSAVKEAKSLQALIDAVKKDISRRTSGVLNPAKMEVDVRRISNDIVLLDITYVNTGGWLVKLNTKTQQYVEDFGTHWRDILVYVKD